MVNVSLNSARKAYLPMAICFFILCQFFASFSSFGQGLQVQRPKGTTTSPYGFYEYLPIGYDTDTSKDWPILVCLHGQGELGNGTTDLAKAIVNGPGKEIKNGRHFPMIVVSPQSMYWWNSTTIDQFVEYLKKTYRMDENRLYLTGLSMGGIVAWEYAAKYPDKVAALVAIAGNGNAQDPCQLAKIPVWAFHGDADPTVSKYGSINTVNAINACTNPVANPQAKLTMYPGVGHDSWTRTYNGSAGHDIYAWMLQYSKTGTTNVPPTVSAGADKTIQLPTNQIIIVGTGTDTDGSIASYSWVKVSGPSTTLTNQTTASLTAALLVAGSYVFELTVTDNLGSTASDQMTLVVKPLAVNQAPTANAGADLNITLPQTSVLITGSGTDTDGSIATYAWSQQSGTPTTISDPTKAQITVGSLTTAGTYVFRLTVTDDKGATGIDDVTITVNPAAANQKPTVTLGTDMNVSVPQSTVVIKGTASDADGTIAAYSWTKISGPALTFINETTAEVTVNDLVEGVYVLRLTVKDDDGEEAFDEIQITVLAQVNQAPTANAGSNQVLVLPTNTTNIVGSGVDTDGTVVSYQWIKVSGPAGDLANETTPVLTLNNLVAGVYVFSLTVTDDKGASGIDEVTITVQLDATNLVPTVSAGANLNVVMPIVSVDIQATATDPDGTIQSYAWTKISGGAVTLTNTTTSKLTVAGIAAGNYVFRITVTDNDGGQASDDVELIVSPETINKSPIVTANGDVILTLPVNSTVLTASATDPDGTIASFAWIKVSGPAATIQDEGTAFLSLTNLVEGSYVFRVTVTDNGGATDTDEVMITVKPSGAQTCNCDHVIEANKEYVKAQDMVPAVKPGDVICVRAGTRGYIRFLDFVGTADQPLTFINCGGQVVINNPTVDGSLSFTRCRYFRITGTGDPNYTYGFKIAVSTKNTAMFISETDFEIDHIEIGDSGFAGIMAKIDPTCDNPEFHRGNFVMQNIKIHDNFIHDVKGEGFYIGYYAYGGLNKSPCGMVYPHDIKNIKIYNNIFRNTAADGIQVTCAVENCEIYNNSIENYGTDPFSTDQNNGIIVGGGTTGLCYNNYIANGTGVGLAVFGIGNNTIFNNIIVNAGSHGAYFGEGSTIDGRFFNFSNNTIVNPKGDGIRFQNTKAKNNKFYNNIIVNPGTWQTYEDANFCADGDDAFFYANCSIGMDYDSANNLFTRNIANVKFVNPANFDFRLTPTSRAVDKGKDVSAYGITFDHYKLARPSNGLFDQGATEFQNDGSTNKVPTIAMPANQIITLPTNSTTLTANATDEDGTIASYAWTQTSGPSQADLTNPNTKTLTAKTLIVGEYVFKLTVFDNLGASAFGETRVTVKATSTNQAPVANAGVNKTITLPTSTTILNGSGTDADGTIASYAWSKVSGPTVTMANQTTANLSLSALVAGVYVFKLTVTDNLGAQGSAQVTVTVQPAAVNKPPVANAGGDKTITLPINSITLIGSGSDADGTITNYVWTKQSGPAAPPFVATLTPNLSLANLVEGIYVFRLTVTDDKGATAFADAKVTVLAATAAKPPVVNAGSDILITLPTNSAVINGTASADGTITSYAWTKRSGPAATLTNGATSSLQLSGLVSGVYVFRLTVVDNNLLSAFDEVTVTVIPANVNSSPIANGGGDKTIKLPTSTATLVGSGNDADGTITTYAWSQLEGAPVQFSDLSLPSLTISDLTVGVYKFRLTVTDDKGATGSNDVVVTVVAETTNVLPIANAGADILIYLPANSVVLSGTGTDSDGTIVGYSWTKLSGSSFTISDANAAVATLSNLLEGSYTFRLTVTDDKGGSGTDDVTVSVLPESVNQAPSADAGPDISVRLPVAEIVVQGSGSDPDGQIISYTWVQKEGEAITIAGANTSQLILTNLKAGGYTFELTVNDNKGEIASDIMQIVVLAERTGPEAYAGVDTVVNMPVEQLLLVGFGSVQEGSISAYLWEKKSGPDVVLNDYESSVLTLTSVHSGEYLFAFTVTDDLGVSATDDVVVNVTEQLYAPKVFTPNGDGQNDVWEIKNMDLIQGCPLVIYDKLGTKVFEASTYVNDWDGIYKGKKLEAGPYYYIFKCDESKVVTGGVRIVR